MNAIQGMDELYPSPSESDRPRRWRLIPTRLITRQIVLLWVFGYLLVEIGAVLQGRSAPGTMFLVCIPLLVTGSTMCLALDRFGNRLRARGLGAPLVWSVLALCGVVVGITQTVLDTGLNYLMAMAVFPSWRSWATNFYIPRLTTIYMLYQWTVFLSLALAAAGRSVTAAQQSAVRAAESDASASRAEAAALRLQLNPHFLFNALNGISSLVVRQRNDDAEEAIGRLADFLRASLASEPGELVSLDRELETVAAYLAVEEGRLGDRLSVRYDVAPGLESLQIPNFIIQPLVENAIKHGASAHVEQTLLTVSAHEQDGWALIGVTNRLAGASGAPEAQRSNDTISHGIGLANTRRRLAVHYGKDAQLRCAPLIDGYRCEIAIRIGPAA